MGKFLNSSAYYFASGAQIATPLLLNIPLDPSKNRQRPNERRFAALGEMLIRNTEVMNPEQDRDVGVTKLVLVLAHVDFAHWS